MQRYFFHLAVDGMIVEDEDGSELPGIEAAQHEAEVAARELIANAIRAGNDNIPEAIVIADELGRALHRIDVKTVLPRKLRA
jgi:hypothetical protein